MITFEHVTYTYPDAPHPALHDVSFSLPEASFTLVVGASGAGKSTLLRCVNGLVPHFSGGVLQGTLSVCGLDPVQAAPHVMCRSVGFVFQDPETQFVVDQVEDEIAFALENSAMPRQEMRVRVEEVLDLLDLAPLRNRQLNTLSGGERQRVAIAAALALRPHILVLDEPTSQLDPKSAEDVLNALVRLNNDLGLTIVLAEHRLERVLSFVDGIIYLSDSHSGVIVGPPETVLCEMDLTPPLVTLGKALGWEPLPLTIKDGMRFARKELGAREQRIGTSEQGIGASEGHAVIRARAVDVSYGNQQVLRHVHIDVWARQVVAVMGRNGAGKTTLLKALVGLVRPRHGRIEVGGRDSARLEVAEICQDVGYLPQDPNALLFADTVREELMITLRNHGLDDKQVLSGEHGDTSGVQALLTRLGLADKTERYPRDLSAGERQRVALAAIAVTQPGTLLLDEPTRGLDYLAKQELVDLLRGWRNGGMAIVLVTHDVEFAAALADRVVLMSQGEMIADGPPSEIMGASPLFAPQVARLFPSSGWLTPNDVFDALQ